MKRVNKWRYLWIVQSHYGNQWDDETAEENYKEARQRVKEYRDNCDAPIRLIHRRELNPDYQKEG